MENSIHKKSSAKNVICFCSLVLILVFPNDLLMNSSSISARLSTLIYVISSILVLSIIAFLNGKLRVVSRVPYVLVLYFLWVLIRFVWGVIESSGMIELNEIQEVFRPLILMIFFLLGVQISSFTFTDDSSLKVFAIIFSLLLSYLIFAWVFPFSKFFIYDLYITREGRFNGLSPSVNYIWITMISVFSILVVGLGSKSYGKTTLMIWIAILSLAAIFLSGSRTSLIAVCAFLIALVAFDIRVVKSFKVVTSFLIFLTICILIVPIVSDDFGRSMERFTELLSADNYEEIGSLDSRVLEFNERLDASLGRPIFGYGVNRDSEPFFHNSFQRSVYRYGLIGLILELSVFFTMFIYALRFRKNIVSKGSFAVVSSLMLAYFLASMVSLTFYELKAPYVLFFTFGFLLTRIQQQSNFSHKGLN